MEPYGDPEARIRDLERPLADRASASELGTQPYDAAPPPPPPPQGPPTMTAYPTPSPGEYGAPQYTSPYFAPPQQVVHKRSPSTALWLVPLVIVVVVAAGIVGAAVFFNLGGSDGRPQGPIAGGGGPLDTPSPPEVQTRIDSTEQIVTVESGGSLSIGGIGQNQTVVCNGGSVNISGVDNTIEVQGGCASVTVSGIDNTVTVESADILGASGFDNQVTYRSGDPEISQSGTGNVIERG